ncbi:GntR family transcriptional regulator [Sphingobacterium sp. T2]|uniref:GntR family transcriptional regulator n=1 Tax=Sphingobacterium sp. T2 TaxID=1590596 RepID=UPI001E4B237F|nr:GntR family transcriptional regulator [Sphingobacterium sp. T2]
MLGVSRTVVREALLRLKSIGLIESKKHKGAVITNLMCWDLLKRSFIPLFWIKTHSKTFSKCVWHWKSVLRILSSTESRKKIFVNSKR